MGKRLCYVEGTKYFKLSLEKLIYDKKRETGWKLVGKDEIK